LTPPSSTRTASATRDSSARWPLNNVQGGSDKSGVLILLF
jgi:hypothetical protein